MRRSTTAILLGLALATFPRTALADPESSEPTQFSLNNANLTATWTTAGSLLSSTVVAGVLWLAIEVSGDGEGDSKKKSKARALLDIGLIADRQDLAMLSSLLVRSSSAFDQMDLDAARGHGPGLEAFARATGAPVDRVSDRWRASRAALGAPADDAAAARFVADFLARLAPEVRVEPTQAANLIWRLVREPSAASDDASAHARVARWLGVPTEAVVAASAFEGLDDRTRAEIRRDPGAWLDVVAARVEAAHPVEVEARLSSVAAAARPWMPAWTVGDGGAASADP